MPLYSKIVSSGSYLPTRIVTNNELAQMFDTSDEWIRSKVGVVARHFASPEEGVSDLALHAAKEALKNAGLVPKDIDAIIFATTTPEQMAPGSGVLLQHKLGCGPCPAFDVRNTSPGFLYSLDLADGLIKTGRYKTILVVGAEIISRILDFSNQGRKMAVIFGDGAGCVLLRSTRAKTGIRDIVLHSNGVHADKLCCTKHPTMEGKYVFDHAVKFLAEAAMELLEKNHLKIKDIDFFLSHQGNLRIIEKLCETLKLNPGKVPTNIEHCGNTSAASIPILFSELSRTGQLKSGQRILMMSIGAGFCWGAGLVET